MSQRDASVVREHLIRVLEADLIGPFSPNADPLGEDELLPLPPSRYYFTGFLAPERDRDPLDPSSDDEAPETVEDDQEESSPQEPEVKQRRMFPASIGLSVLLPPGDATDTVTVRVRFAEYIHEDREVEGEQRPRRLWRRHARTPPPLVLRLDPRELEQGTMLPETPLVKIIGKLESAPSVGKGVRALSLFVVNHRTSDEKGLRDEAYLFQVELELEYAAGFVARPTRHGEDAADWDDKVADLQFREHTEVAVGHGVSAEHFEAEGRITRVRSRWLPTAEVRRVVTHDEPGVTTSMEELAGLEDGPAAQKALGALVEAYGVWLKQQSAIQVDSKGREDTKRTLLETAERARQRIRSGIERLAKDPEALWAFRLTNQAMALSARKRSPESYERGELPRWRLFQLAFLLLNLEGLVDEAHGDREQVELIFFPTGGGKTEAYLGVIAFTLLWRRMKGQERPDKGLGVAVLLRYTLRLLTLDQLGRAATLVCALETLRVQHLERLGAERFAVGLWVGKSATANTLQELKRQVLDYKNGVTSTSPFPLTQCPWCGQELGKESLALVPSPAKAEAIVVGCSNFRCEFAARKNKQGLPVVFVDEQIYRELPAFLVATVDKFAMLPWRGETGMLFGRVQSVQEGRFFGPMDAFARGATPLPDGLRPPELIVQDELHLISGPLGTMVGLYETAIDHLCQREGKGGKPVVPKILASTATVRRAQEQIQALFGRSQVALFPPPAVNASETWFARVDREGPGRLYLGVAAPGRSMKGILLRSYVALLAAAERKRADAKGEDELAAADPYLTLAGYFNSLRELGGMRRLVEDEVRSLCSKADQRRPANSAGEHPWLAKRAIQPEPVELTSRESTAKIKAAKERLGRPFADAEHVDVLLASNMISVGVDIDRLGLMVVAGQPKTTAEYIQASSRVGRAHPGLVVTCFNVTKPRDRSHYERFRAYHESFYRFVEATSLTPFSAPAMDRGLAGTLVAMTRLRDAEMTPPESAMRIDQAREALGKVVVEALAMRAGLHDHLHAEEHERLVSHVRERGEKLLDAWTHIVHASSSEGAARRSYSRFDRDRSGKSLLIQATDEALSTATQHEQRFVAPTSMRDVEESVHLWINRGRALGGKG